MSKKNSDKIARQNYLALREEMGSFDVLCCEHKKWPYTWIGHTAVIYKNEVGQLMVLESTSLNKWSGISGVQLNPLGLWLKNYNGKVYWRKWVWGVPVSGYEKTEALHAFQRFIGIYRGTSYPEGFKGFKILFKAWWDSPFFKKRSTNPVITTVMFCSHLVAELFMAIRFLRIPTTRGGNIPASEYIPEDFREGDYVDVTGEYLRGHLAPEVLIKDV